MSSLLVFCLGWWCGNFVDSESGQEQSVNSCRIWSTTQLNSPPPTPQPHNACLYILYVYFGKGGRGEGGQREGRGALVHKRGRKYQNDWLYLLSITLLNTSKDDIYSRFCCLYSSFIHGWWRTSTLEVARRAPPGRAGCRVALRRNGDIGSGRSAARLVISSIEESRFAYT